MKTESIKDHKYENISVPHFEGYKCVGYTLSKRGQYFLKRGKLEYADVSQTYEWLTYEKLPPKRYIFEETGEKRQASYGEYYLSNDENFMLHPSLKDTVGVYPILRRIDE